MNILPPNQIFLLYITVFSVSALICIGSTKYLKKIEDKETRKGLTALLLTSAGWSLSHLGFIISTTTTFRLIWYYIGLILGLLAVGAWLYFCSAYTGRTYHLEPSIRKISLLSLLAISLVKITNPIHGLYFNYTPVSTPFPHLAIHTGILHWTTMGMAYSLALLGGFMLFELFIEIYIDTKPLIALLGITGLPLIFNIIGYSTPYLIDITYEPLGVAIFAIGVTGIYLEKFDEIQIASEKDIPVIALTTDQKILDANRTATDLFPELKKCRKKPLSEILPEVAEKKGDRNAVIKKWIDGTPRYFQLNETTYGSRTGTGYKLVFSDITEREQYKNELERLNQRLEKFASMISHDLRNPLNVAMARLENIRNEVTDEEQIEVIDRALNRMNSLIDEILTLKQHGKRVEEWQTVNLEEIVNNCWGMVDTENAELIIESNIKFKGDPSRLKRVFENLIRNSVMHAGKDVRIRIGAMEDMEGFYFEDNGPGIPSEHKESIFEAGYSTREKGTGFGLAIVYEAVAAHGWRIEIKNGEQGGTRFEVTGIDSVDN